MGKNTPCRTCQQQSHMQQGLTEEEQNERLPSGQKMHYNNVSWARTYLKEAGLISSPRRAYIVITKAGKELLQTDPENADEKRLIKVSQLCGFYKKNRQDNAKRKIKPKKI